MEHHLIKEPDLRDFCPYCRNRVNGDRWQSRWHLDQHYKTISCRECERDIWLKVAFDSDGYDWWDGNRVIPALSEDSTLEMRLTNTGNAIKPIKK